MKPITQALKFTEPVRAVIILKEIQGPQRGDVIMANPMVTEYVVTLEGNQLKFEMTLADDDHGLSHPEISDLIESGNFSLGTPVARRDACPNCYRSGQVIASLGHSPACGFRA